MRKPRLAYIVPLLLAAMPSIRLRGATDSWLSPVSGNWSDVGNWSLGVVPNNGIPTGTTYNVQINSTDAAFTVTLDTAVVVDTLALSAQGTLSLLPTESLTITAGSVFNAGKIAAMATATPTQISFTTNATLSGGGTISLTGDLSAITGVAGVQLTSNNTIVGFGSIGMGNLAITNSGTIIASGGVLNLFPQNLTNTGILRADGGTLVISASTEFFQYSTYSNQGGIVEALNGSLLTLTRARLQGGVVRGLSGGTVFLKDVFAENLSFDGNVVLQASQGNTGSLDGIINSSGNLTVLNGSAGIGLTTIRNSGTLTLQQGNLYLWNPSTLTLGGTVILNGSNSGFQGHSRLTTDNLIIGTGTITCDISNSGTITASGGTLAFVADAYNFFTSNFGTFGADGGSLTFSGVFQNNGGIVQARNNAAITFIPYSSYQNTFSGGTLSCGTGSTITMRNTAFSSTLIENSGLLSVGGSMVFNTGNTISNLGVITLLDAATVSISTTVLHNSGTIVLGKSAIVSSMDLILDGGGKLLLNSSTSTLSVTGNALLATNNEIAGVGVIGQGAMKISNAGTITATGGTLTINALNATNGFLNTGILRADSGTLVLLSTVNNTQGKIEALQGSGVSIAGTVISGTIQGSAGIISLSNASLQNLTLVGNINLNARTSFSGTINNYGILTTLNSSTLTLVGTLNNTGTISLARQLFASLADGYLTGGGTILMNSALSNFVGTTNRRIITDNFIFGKGTIGLGNSKFTNSGSIIASGGLLTIVPTSGADSFINNGTLGADAGTLTLSVANATYVNSNGILKALNGGVVNINGSLAGGNVLSNSIINFNTNSAPQRISGSGTIAVALASTVVTTQLSISNLLLNGILTLTPGGGASQLAFLNLAADTRLCLKTRFSRCVES